MRAAAIMLARRRMRETRGRRMGGGGSKRARPGIPCRPSSLFITASVRWTELSNVGIEPASNATASVACLDLDTGTFLCPTRRVKSADPLRLCCASYADLSRGWLLSALLGDREARDEDQHTTVYYLWMDPERVLGLSSHPVELYRPLPCSHARSRTFFPTRCAQQLMLLPDRQHPTPAVMPTASCPVRCAAGACRAPAHEISPARVIYRAPLLGHSPAPSCFSPSPTWRAATWPRRTPTSPQAPPWTTSPPSQRAMPPPRPRPRRPRAGCSSSARPASPSSRSHLGLGLGLGSSTTTLLAPAARRPSSRSASS
jgi:hypothetical protein